MWNKPTLHFVHGKESGPNGTKISLLRAIADEFNWQTESLSYRDLLTPEERLNRLDAQLEKIEGPIVLAGSSMGGWVSVAAAQARPIAGLFLMAPALDLQGYPHVEPTNCTGPLYIVHGWRDEVIPWENSLSCAKKYAAPLLLLDDDHRLSASAVQLSSFFKTFLQCIQTGGNR